MTFAAAASRAIEKEINGHAKKLDHEIEYELSKK